MNLKNVCKSYGLIFFALMLVWSCGVSDSEDSNGLGRELTLTEKKIIEADQSFSIDIFKEIVVQDTSENMFISPLSISVALGMSLNGAKGDTFDEMREALVLGRTELDDINKGYNSLIELLTNADPKVVMEIANSVWTNEGFNVENEFSTALEQYFEAEAKALDFLEPTSVDVINGWVADKTHNKIETVLASIPPTAIMYLINAVYFNGTWKYAFDTESTSERRFTLLDDSFVTVDMMNQQNSFPFLVSEEVQMVDLPYGDGMFSMTMLLPAEDIPINEFIEKDFSFEKFTGWLGRLEDDTVGVFIPKLEIEYKVTLNNMLKSLGVETPFTQEADFTGINKSGELFISSVLHKTFLKMDEEGTEAAGVTVVEFGVTSIGESSFPTIRFDRPYIFVLRERSSGAILFMGKIGNPLAE